MPVQINITGGDAAEAVKELTSLQSFMSAAKVEQTPVLAAPVNPAAPAPEIGQTPHYGVQQPAPQSVAAPSYGQASAPTYQSPQAPAPQSPNGAVPTTAPAYSLDQLGVAAQPLIDAGQGPALLGWIGQRGAQALTQLNPQYYGDFATFLRSLGARI
ncbi:hypothetical protein D3C75_359530 [compost metagenome]